MKIEYCGQYSTYNSLNLNIDFTTHLTDKYLGWNTSLKRNMKSSIIFFTHSKSSLYDHCDWDDFKHGKCAG